MMGKADVQEELESQIVAYQWRVNNYVFHPMVISVQDKSHKAR